MEKRKIIKPYYSKTPTERLARMITIIQTNRLGLKIEALKHYLTPKQMKVTVTGKIIYIHPIENRGKYRSRKIGVESEDGKNYGCKAEYNKCYMLDEFHPGDTVTIHAEIIGKMWSGSYITNVIVNDVEMIDDSGTKQQRQKEKELKEFRRNPRPITRVNLHEKTSNVKRPT